MTARAALARVLASALLAAVACVDVAHAGRLDDAAGALRTPGVWVDADLTWLVGPAAERRLEREIDQARVPVRVAVLPQIEVDESYGDQRAIVRGIMSRVDRDGLYVLVDQEGDVVYAARRLPLDLSEYSFPRGKGLDAATLDESLDALVPTVRAARPGPPVSFEPYPNPKGITSSGSRDDTPLAVVAFVSALLGAALGFALFWLARVAVGVAGVLRQRA